MEVLSYAANVRRTRHEALLPLLPQSPYDVNRFCLHSLTMTTNEISWEQH